MEKGAVVIAATFSAKLSMVGRIGDQVIVPVCRDDGMPQLATAEAVLLASYGRDDASREGEPYST